MKKIVLLNTLCLLFATAFSQSNRERVHIKGGSEMWSNFTKEMLLYPEFREGVVEYKNRQRFQRKMNYNKALETVQFIDENNDTLAIANESAVNFITIGDDKFVYRPSCLQDLTPQQPAKLYRHQKVRVADIRRKGAMGIPNSTSAIESANQLYAWMNAFQLDVNELLLISKETDYYIPSADGQMLPASRKNILQQHAENENKIQDYLSNKRINFSRESDLVELITYISSLKK